MKKNTHTRNEMKKKEKKNLTLELGKEHGSWANDFSVAFPFSFYCSLSMSITTAIIIFLISCCSMNTSYFMFTDGVSNIYDIRFRFSKKVKGGPRP